MSPWWRDTVTRFYTSGKRTLVIRAGRRAGKSSTLSRIAVLEALYGDHKIPPGDLGVVAIISINRDEASQRLRTIKTVLDAIGCKYKPIDGGIELLGVGRPVGFKVYTASIGGVSGFTCISAICDEAAKWADTESGANPAKEVLASLRPTMATQPNAHLFLSSSPFGMADAHARAFADGDDASQMVAHAPTWIANPTITEEQTRRDEKDERVWRREYLAEPQAGDLSAFNADAVKRAFGRTYDLFLRGEPILVLDPSSGKKDTWTWGVARWVRPVDAPDDGSRDLLRFELLGGLEGGFWQHTTGTDVVDRLAGIAAQWGIKTVHSDQRESMMLSSEFRKRGLAFVEHSWTARSKTEAVERVRRWFAESMLDLPEHEVMHKELLNFEERITPSGSLTFAARGNGHDDYVSLLITAAMADMDHAILPAAHGQTALAPKAIRSKFGGGVADLFVPTPGVK